MVVHPLSRELVARVPLPEVLLAHNAKLVQQVQRPVHRRQPQLRVSPLNPVVDFLRRKVPAPLQLPHYRPPLVRQPVPATPEYMLEFTHLSSLARSITSIKNRSWYTGVFEKSKGEIRVVSPAFRPGLRGCLPTGRDPGIHTAARPVRRELATQRSTHSYRGGGLGLL